MNSDYVESLTQQHSQRILEQQKQKQQQQSSKPTLVAEPPIPTPPPPPPISTTNEVFDIDEQVARFDFIRYDQIGFGDVNTQYQRKSHRTLPHPLDETNFRNGYEFPSCVSRLLHPPAPSDPVETPDPEPVDDDFADPQVIYRELDATRPICEPREPAVDEADEEEEDELNRPRSPFWNSVETVHEDVAEQQRQQHEQLLRLSQQQVPNAHQKRFIDQITTLRSKVNQRPKKKRTVSRK